MSLRCVFAFPFATDDDDDGAGVSVAIDGVGNDVSLFAFGLTGVNMWVSFIVPLLPGTVYESDVCDGSESMSPKSFVYKSTLAIDSDSIGGSVPDAVAAVAVNAVVFGAMIGAVIGVSVSDPSVALCDCILCFARSIDFTSSGMCSSCGGGFCAPSNTEMKKMTLKFRTLSINGRNKLNVFECAWDKLQTLKESKQTKNRI